MGKIDFPIIFPVSKTMNLVFTDTLPAEEDLKKIEDEAAHEQTVAGYFRPLFKKMFIKGYGLAVYNSNTLLGVICAVPFGRNWVEPGTFFVLKSYRGCGVGSALVKELLTKFKGNKKIYVATKSSIIIEFCERVGLKQCKSYWNLPLTVKWHLLKKITMVRYKFIRTMKLNFHKGIRFYLSPEN